MKLTDAQQKAVAQRAQFFFDVAVSPNGAPTVFGDNSVFTGQGLKDLNGLLGFLSFNPAARVTCEIGSPGTALLGNAFPQYLRCDVDDIYAIRTAYVTFYGSVDRPNVYRDYGGGAFMTSNGTVVPPVILTGTAPGTNSPPGP